MPERVEYEAMPGTRYDQYVQKLRAIADALAQKGGTDYKTFRSKMRELGIWDREKAPLMLDLVDVEWDRKKVRVGPLMGKIQKAESDEEVQELLFQRLRHDNILLLKYVFDALDVETGGRLHSVHELYRMITSYVYPGKYITLPNFKAWVEWLAATGYIKMIGIRWALSEWGEQVMSEFRSMDVEEILEDLEEEQQGGAEPEAEDDDEAAEAETSEPPAAAEEPAGTSGEEAAAVAPAEEDEDDLFDDLPPEPEPPSDEQVAQAEQQFAREFGDVEEPVQAMGPQAQASARASAREAVSAARPVGLHEPLAGTDPAAGPVLVASSTDESSVVETLVAWWRQWEPWPRLDAHALGVEAPGEGADARFLAELATFALLIEGLPAQPQLLAFARRLRELGFLEALHGEEGFEAALDRVEPLFDEPWARPLSGRLLQSRRVWRRAAETPGLLDQVRDARDGATAVRLIRGKLLGGGGVEAPFWILRELLRLEVVDRERLGDTAAVPTRRLLHNARRIGLLTRADALTFDELVEISRAVSSRFGAEAGWGEALEVMDRGLGLAEAEV